MASLLPFEFPGLDLSFQATPTPTPPPRSTQKFTFSEKDLKKNKETKETYSHTETPKSSETLAQLLEKVEKNNKELKELRLAQLEHQKESDKIQLQIEGLILLLKERQSQLQEKEQSIAKLKKDKATLLSAMDETDATVFTREKEPNSARLSAAVKPFNLKEEMNDIFKLQEILKQLQNKLKEVINARIVTQQQEVKLFKDVERGASLELSKMQDASMKLECECSLLSLSIASDAEGSQFLPGFGAGVGSGVRKRKEIPAHSPINLPLPSPTNLALPSSIKRARLN